MQVVIFFATNPDEHLTSSDVVAKFGAKRSTVWHRLQPMILDGYITRLPHPSNRRGSLLVAGPRLLAEIGRG